MIMEQARMFVRTGLLPKAIDTPEKAVLIMTKGREINIPPTYALSNINVINGRPTCSAELMLSLIYRDQGDTAIDIPETTNERCVIHFKRRGWREHRSYAFTIQDARQAGLNNDNWRKYPAAMLRARCISAVARMAFPDCIAGMYTPEEMGAETDPESGNIVNATATAQPVLEATFRAETAPETPEARLAVAAQANGAASAETVGLNRQLREAQTLFSKQVKEAGLSSKSEVIDHLGSLGIDAYPRTLEEFTAANEALWRFYVESQEAADDIDPETGEILDLEDRAEGVLGSETPQPTSSQHIDAIR